MDIRRRGNIIAHEKTVKIANTETISQETIESLRKDLEEHKDDLSTVYKAAQPVCSDVCIFIFHFMRMVRSVHSVHGNIRLLEDHSNHEYSVYFVQIM